MSFTSMTLDAVHPIERQNASSLGGVADGLAYEVDVLTAPEWDRLAATFDDLNLFQTAAYADGLRGEGRMSHLLLRRNGIPVAGARVGIMKPPAFPVGVAYVKNGPFWRRAGMPPDKSVYRAAIAALVEEYGALRGHMISISPRPHPQFQLVEQRLLGEAGFVFRPKLNRPLTFFLVNTGLGEEALKASLSQAWRSNLKKALQNGLEIRFCDPVDALPQFYAMHDAMVARKRFVQREPIHLLPLIFRHLPPSCSHFVTASHEGEVVAGAVVIVAGDVAYYLYGASTDAALPLRAGYALHWRIACWLAERGVPWYDLGDGFSGVGQFKQGFVGKSGAMIERAGEFDRWLRPQARIAGDALYGARNLVTALRRWKKRLVR